MAASTAFVTFPPSSSVICKHRPESLSTLRWPQTAAAPPSGSCDAKARGANIRVAAWIQCCFALGWLRGLSHTHLRRGVDERRGPATERNGTRVPGSATTTQRERRKNPNPTRRSCGVCCVRPVRSWTGCVRVCLRKAWTLMRTRSARQWPRSCPWPRSLRSCSPPASDPSWSHTE